MTENTVDLGYDVSFLSYICQEKFMDPILQILLNWQFVCFGLAIAAMVFMARKVLEYLMETYTSFSKESKFWNDLVLPILPIILGMGAAWLIKGFPYPDGITTVWSRIIWGMGDGLLSGFMFRMIKSLMIQKVTTITSNASQNPPTNSANLPQRGSL